MNLKFFGAAETVTGSCYLLSVAGKQILIDCGMFQGPGKLMELNRLDFQFDPSQIDFLLLTHAHIDHSGMIPKLVKCGFNAPILTTGATKDLCEIMLPDSAHIQEEEIKWHNRKRMRAGKKQWEALYTVDDALESMKYFKEVAYGEPVTLTPEISACFHDAGHILGASSIQLTIKENGKQRRIVFSGDIGNADQAIVKDTVPFDKADHVLVETTYADRYHKSRKETVAEFRDIIEKCLEHGGNIVIPAFAVERTQEIIYEFGQMCREGFGIDIPIYVDSPLAISATEIFRKHPECYDEKTWDVLRGGENPLDMPKLHFSRSVDESRHINDVDRAIIVSASGMCHAGRIKHHLKHNLWRPESHVIFVGYQAVGTIGRKIIEGAKSVKLFGEEIAVKAQIHTLGGFSAHADHDGIIAWLKHFDPEPKDIFLTHGELSGMKVLARDLKKEFKSEVRIPAWIEDIDL